MYEKEHLAVELSKDDVMLLFRQKMLPFFANQLANVVPSKKVR
jgi:hypothetical protein